MDYELLIDGRTADDMRMSMWVKDLGSRSHYIALIEAVDQDMILEVDGQINIEYLMASGSGRSGSIKGTNRTRILMSDFILETNQLTKRYSRRILAVDGLDIQIPKGQVFGLLGPNGSGKTTTLGMILGVISKTSGSFSWFGQGEDYRLTKKCWCNTGAAQFLSLSKCATKSYRAQQNQRDSKPGF